MTSMLRWTPEQLRAHQERVGRAMAKKDPEAAVDIHKDVTEALERQGVIAGKAKRMKMGNTHTVVDGISFDSAREAERYTLLKLSEREGTIRDLRHHVTYPLDVNGIHICDYEADFVYFDMTGRKTGVPEGRIVVEDVKYIVRAKDEQKKKLRRSAVYRLFMLKKALMQAVHGITVMEV